MIHLINVLLKLKQNKLLGNETQMTQNKKNIFHQKHDDLILLFYWNLEVWTRLHDSIHSETFYSKMIPNKLNVENIFKMLVDMKTNIFKGYLKKK